MNQLYDNLWIAVSVAWTSLPFQAAIAVGLGGAWFAIDHGCAALAPAAILAGLAMAGCAWNVD
jgi:hypothetical protein